MRSGLQRLFSRNNRPKRCKGRTHLRQSLRCESLEERRLLAGDTWESVIDGGGFAEVASYSTGDSIVAKAVTGQFELAKFATDGQQLWNIDLPIMELNGQQRGRVSALEIAPSGDILVAGRYEGSVDFDPNSGQTVLTADGEDGFIASYSDNGASLTLNWAHLVGDRVTDIEVDSGGGVAAVGTFGATLDYDAVQIASSNTGLTGSFLANVAVDGSLLKARQIEDAGVFSPVAVDVNSAGDLFVAGSNSVDDLSAMNSSYSDLIVDGQLVSSSDNQDGFVMKFSNGGAAASFDWSYRFGESDLDERMADMEVSSSGEIYLAAESRGKGESLFAGVSLTTTGWDAAAALGKITVAGGMPVTDWVHPIQPEIVTDSNYLAEASVSPRNLALQEASSGSVTVYVTGVFAGTVEFNSAPNEVNFSSRNPRSGNSTFSTNYDGFLVALDSDGVLDRAWQVGNSLDMSTSDDGTVHLVGNASTHSPTLVVGSHHGAGTSVIGLNPEQPTVVFDPPEEMSINDSVTVEADAYDLNNSDISSSIVWTDSLGMVLGSGSTVTLSGLPEDTHTILATATDTEGRTGSFTFDLQVNSEPIAIPDPGTLVVSKTINAAEAVVIDDVNVTVDISHNRNDNVDVFLIAPDGTRVELFTDIGGRYGRNFSGTTLDSDAAESVATYSAPHSGTFRPEGDLSVLNGKNSEGTWSLEITDDRRRDTGSFNWWSLDISGSPAVPNDPPVITSTPVTAGTQDAAYVYDVDATDPDAGDTLSYSLDDSPDGMTIDSATGIINWTPSGGQVGANDVTVRVEDQLGAFDTQTFSINVANVNDAPVAVDDSYDLEQDTLLNISAAGLLNNDTDADGDTLAVVQHTEPASGNLAVNADGSFSYTPSQGFVGTDSFTYRVNDGTVDGNTATVTLEVNAASTDEALYVYDIRFESKRGNKDWRAVFEIRSDSNANGVGDSGDNAVAGVAITVTFGGNTYSGTTDSNGVFRTSWIRNLPGGSYYANVDSLLASGYAWDPLDALNRENDSDGDGFPDDLLSR